MTLVGAHLEWEKGGSARFVAASADAVTLASSVPSPPGSRISGTLVDEPCVAVRLKVHGCRAEPDGTFRIEGRPLDLTREVRTRLEAMIGERVTS
jgi:hypothetical protein